MKRIDINKLLFDEGLFATFASDIKNGAVAVIPTDTLYGFAVAAHSKEAVSKVYQIKNRSEQKPLILFIHSIEELQNLNINPTPETLAQLKQFWPGALTAVLPANSHRLLAAFSFPNIGIRIPKHPPLLKLLEKLPFKLLTTSANRSAAPSERDPDAIAKEFSNEIDWLLDSGILKPSLASTVANFSVFPPLILRQGEIEL